MELTTAQIQKVATYLEAKKFNYLDLKDEILDHMISDIEYKMSRNIAFENAYVMTKIRWEKHFRETSSFYFGMFYSESKIVITNALKMFKPFYFIYLSAYILPVIILKLFPIQVSKSFADFVNGFLLSTSGIALSYLVYIFIKTKMSKIQTTYRFIMKTQYFASVFLVLGVFIGSIFDANGEMNPVFTGFACAGFSVVFICHHFFKKHLEAIQKHQIS